MDAMERENECRKERKVTFPDHGRAEEADPIQWWVRCGVKDASPKSSGIVDLLSKFLGRMMSLGSYLTEAFGIRRISQVDPHKERAANSEKAAPVGERIQKVW